MLHELVRNQYGLQLVDIGAPGRTDDLNVPAVSVGLLECCALVLSATGECRRMLPHAFLLCPYEGLPLMTAGACCPMLACCTHSTE